MRTPAAPAAGLQVGIYAITVLVGAFLLFQVELVMGKFLLPRFGGGPSVWSTSLLVFQLLLLAGYGYAAFVCSVFRPRTQAIIHLSLLAGSGLLMALLPSPVRAGSHWMPMSTGNPVWQITVLLVTAVGIQCVLLSATSPLLQSWFSRQHHSSPYRLYALSNLGSMLGLLTYPSVVERALSLSAQAWVWDFGYVLFLLMAARCAFIHMGQSVALELEPKQKPAKRTQLQDSPESQPRILWLALAACSCTMLLATTNLISEQVGPVPLLWVVPLSLYLLSFVICFDHHRWYRREVFGPLYLVLALVALRTLPSYSTVKLMPLVVIFCSALMAVCMVCHGELARLKPPTEHLTSFYLMVSTGGALGSAAVVLLAPRIFDRFWEFQIALLGCGFLLAVTLVRDRSSWVYKIRHGTALLLASGVVFLASALYFTTELIEWEDQGEIVVARTRNFFGIKTVLKEPGSMEMLHGHTLHGMQKTDPEKQNDPTTYYTRESGIGLLLDHYPRPAGQSELRVGVVGMGAGTLAAYGRAGDYFRFYEIDPSIPTFSLGAHPPFTFVQASQAHIDIVIGDARIEMQEEVSRGEFQNFDILAVDAFSGDSIPVHLLTREAMELYLRHLRSPQSVVAFHVSSNSLDLRPVVEGLARFYHLASVEVDTRDSYQPVWILLSRQPTVFGLPALSSAAHPVEITRPMRLWTDDYSNLYQLFNW